jgi:hypothetical protein
MIRESSTNQANTKRWEVELIRVHILLFIGFTLTAIKKEGESIGFMPWISFINKKNNLYDYLLFLKITYERPFDDMTGNNNPFFLLLSFVLH